MEWLTNPEIWIGLISLTALEIVLGIDNVVFISILAEKLLGVMTAVVVIAMTVMLLSAETISAYVSRHPTIKMLAFSFLLLIGLALIMEGMHTPIPKGYIYFAMGFSIFVEMVNLRVRAKKSPEPVRLRQETPVLEPVSRGKEA